VRGEGGQLQAFKAVMMFVESWIEAAGSEELRESSQRRKSQPGDVFSTTRGPKAR
jgi:hypothetical protein